MFSEKNSPMNNNYIMLEVDRYMPPNIISKNVKIYKTPQKMFRKNKNINQFNISNEINLENIFTEINEGFNDKKRERESLILKISNTESYSEIKYFKNKTPEKDINEIKKSVRHRKINNKKNNYYKNDNIITASFKEEKKEEKKYDQFTFHNKTEKKHNNNNKIRKKLLLGFTDKNLKKINKNVINGKYKLALKSSNKKKYLNLNKSYDDIKNNPQKLNLKLYSKKIINSNQKTKTSINDTLNESNYIKTYHKYNYDFDFDNFNRLNKSLDLPFKYKKKIIKKNNKNIIRNKNKNNNYYNKRNKTEEKIIKKENEFNNIPKKTLFHFRESKILNDSLLNESLKYINNNIIDISFNNDISNINQKKENSIIINFEDLMLIGERLYEIYKALIHNKKVSNQCYEFLSYIFYSSIIKEIRNLIINSELKEVIYSFNYILFFILILYNSSFEVDIINKSYTIFIKTFIYIINIYQIICEFIFDKVNIKFKSNKWINKLKNLLNYFNININNNISNNNISSNAENIKYNTNNIIMKINSILKQFSSNNKILFINFFEKISTKNLENIKNFFDNYIIKEQHIKENVNSKLNFMPESCPFIIENIFNIYTSKYYLVLGLEETLLNFQLSPNNEEEIVKFRPYLFTFLNSVQKYYDLILFTSSDINEANHLIEVIEQKKKYFSYKFYLQHNIIVNNTFVKDISRIGKDLGKIIMVDNLVNNYQFQKGNTILIKSFYGEENNDKKLFYLKEILVKIAKEGGDLRNGIEKYREEIFDKVSSNIYEYNIDL